MHGVLHDFLQHMVNELYAHDVFCCVLSVMQVDLAVDAKSAKTWYDAK